jgi:hypothetical protein
MAELHPDATHHLPSFVTAPGDTDVLMVVMAVILLASVLGFGILFFRLHSLPERMAHRTHKIQFEIVAVLCLISLFTHMHIFWIAGLLLAMIDLPDFGGSLNRIADSAEKIAGTAPEDGAARASPETATAVPQPDEATSAPDVTHAAPNRDDTAPRIAPEAGDGIKPAGPPAAVPRDATDGLRQGALSTKPDNPPVKKKERMHA